MLFRTTLNRLRRRLALKDEARAAAADRARMRATHAPSARVEGCRKALDGVAAACRAAGRLRVGLPKAALATLIPHGGVIVEAGAHKGRDTAEFAAIFPDARVLAFEPHPELAKQARAATHGAENVEIVAAGLGPEAGSKPFHVSGGASSASSSFRTPNAYRTVQPRISFRKTIPARMERLDAALDARGLEKFDFLWLDVQGMELDVLKSVESRLPRASAVFVEVCRVELFDDCALLPETEAFLESCGFAMVLDQSVGRPYGDALFVNRALLPADWSPITAASLTPKPSPRAAREERARASKIA